MAERIEAAKKAARRLREGWTRYQIPVLAGVLGLLLLLWPKEKETSRQTAQTAEEFSVEEMEDRLEALLGRVDGAGAVCVMLTLADEGEVVYQMDETVREGGSEKQTVLADKAPVVAVRQTPRFQGAAVVCEGADRASVRLAVMQAVSSLTGLGHDQITVIKMKGQ